MHKVKLLRQLSISLVILTFAMMVLVTSIFRSAQIRYSFEPIHPKNSVLGENYSVDYELPYPGKVGPNNVLWPLKATRDKMWLGMTTNSLKAAQISLLFADKRMAAARDSFGKGDWGQGVATAQKAEVYLKLSLDDGVKAGDEEMDTSEFMLQLAKAALKHREVLETYFDQAPSDAKTLISGMMEDCREVYSKASQELNERGVQPPNNPFNNS